ncbi:site-specific integrase [Halovulum sp. GXIMD14794]
MRMNIEGLHREVRDGVVRYRIAQKANPKKRRLLPRRIDPQHPEFGDYYRAYRNGLEVGDIPREIERQAYTPKSLRWLVNEYLMHLEREVKAGLKSPLTLRQRKSILVRMCQSPAPKGGVYGDYSIVAPKTAFERLHLMWMDRPAEADNMLKAARAMYRFGIKAGYASQNPAEGIQNIHKSKGGAVPWSMDDVEKYRERHKPGSQAFLYLTILMFTGCRISDAILLGPPNEFLRDGRKWLRWQPVKKGSAPMELPMLAPLERTIRDTTVTGQETYIVGEHGKGFKTSEAMRVRFRKWCDEAGLEGRSSHGVRKAMAELLAEAGMSSRQIMAVLAHTKAATSEIYTAKAERRIMAEQAMNAFQGLNW